MDEAFQGFYDVLEEAQEVVVDDPIFAVRLLLVCQTELTGMQDDCEEYVWDELSATMEQATFEVIAEIQDEAAAKAVTELLISELKRMRHELEDPSLLLNMLIELSLFARSRTQIEQLLQELTLATNEIDMYRLDLLLRLEAQAIIQRNHYVRGCASA
ncbi:MAG: hypothetical protein ABS949_11120 [Solibacillus sp.]